MHTYPIIYEHPKRPAPVRGAALPLFIHNGSYHLTALDIYEDGVADCWELVPVADIDQKVEEGWLDAQPPDGVEICVSSLGCAHVSNGCWELPNDRIAQTAAAILTQINPSMSNLLDLEARRAQIAAEDGTPVSRVWLARIRAEDSVYRLDTGGREVRGAQVPVFHNHCDDHLLTWCFVYQDRLAQVGADGPLVPAETIQELLSGGALATSVPDGAWVRIPGLGRFQAIDTLWYVDPAERWREILNLVTILNGGLDCVEACYQAYVAYQSAPTRANRDRLRAAYEAVPEHQRMFAQRSMDDKDHDITSILYGSRSQKSG